jgi:hypothetical protein
MKVLSWRKNALAGLVAVAGALSAPQAGATGILYQFDNIFSYSGASSPAGLAPWLDATFQDTANGVLLTINDVGLSAGEFLSSIYFNITPADNVNNLIFSYQNGSSGLTSPTIQTGEDGFKADGDGKYDILFNFSTAASGRFGAGDSITYLISGIAGLAATDFSFMSTPAGGHGPFYAAAHIQGIGGSAGNSVWVDPSLGPLILPVPEPASGAVLLFAAGIWCVARFRSLRIRV